MGCYKITVRYLKWIKSIARVKPERIGKLETLGRKHKWSLKIGWFSFFQINWRIKSGFNAWLIFLVA